MIRRMRLKKWRLNDNTLGLEELLEYGWIGVFPGVCIGWYRLIVMIPILAVKKGLGACNVASKALKRILIMEGRVCLLLLRHIRIAVYLASSLGTQDGYKLGTTISIRTVYIIVLDFPCRDT